MHWAFIFPRLWGRKRDLLSSLPSLSMPLSQNTQPWAVFSFSLPCPHHLPGSHSCPVTHPCQLHRDSHMHRMMCYHQTAWVMTFVSWSDFPPLLLFYSHPQSVAESTSCCGMVCIGRVTSAPFLWLVLTAMFLGPVFMKKKFLKMVK